MNDRISELEAQAKVILEWCRQQKELPEGERGVLESRHKPHGEWTPVNNPTWHVTRYEFRLRKRPKTHKATVYWYRYAGGQVGPSLSTQQDHQWPGAVLLGTTTDEFTEPQE